LGLVELDIDLGGLERGQQFPRGNQLPFVYIDPVNYTPNLKEVLLILVVISPVARMESMTGSEVTETTLPG